MKAKKIIPIVLIILVPIIGIIININRKEYLVQLNFDELENKINNKESFVLMISQTTCGHCAEYKPTLREVGKKNDIIIYYIESDLLTEEENKKFLSIINFDATPTTVFIKSGEEKSMATRIVGGRDSEYVTAKLKSNGFIK